MAKVRMGIKNFLRWMAFGLTMPAGTVSAAPPWEYAAVPQSKMHLAMATVATGVAGVTEIITYSCISGTPCMWSLSIAMECVPGDMGLAVVTTPDVFVPGHKGQPASFVQCGGPNTGLPGTFVYGVQRPDIFNQLALLSRTLTLRVSLAKGDRMRDVRVSYDGAASAISRANANHGGK